MLLLQTLIYLNSAQIEINEIYPFAKNGESEWIELSISSAPKSSSNDTINSTHYFLKSSNRKTFDLDSIVQKFTLNSAIKTHCLISEKELAPSSIPLSCHFILKPWPSLSNSGGFLELWADSLIQKASWPSDKKEFDFKSYSPLLEQWSSPTLAYEHSNATLFEFDFRSVHLEDSNPAKIVIQLKVPCEYQFKINDNKGQKLIAYKEYYKANEWQWLNLYLNKKLAFPLHFIAQCKDQSQNFKELIL